MSDPTQPLTCAHHGESHATFVCRHLATNAGLGVVVATNLDDPRPDAWCEVCHAVVEREGGWESPVVMAHAQIRCICAGCYDLVLRRNVIFEPIPAETPYACATCREAHAVELLDIGFQYPEPYLAVPEAERRARTRINTDVCLIDGSTYLIRGCLEIPLVDAPGRFVWGIWVSLSEASFTKYIAHYDDDEGINEEPMFGWFCSALPTYPETQSLKSSVHLRTSKTRPYVELEPTEHRLAVEQREGITLARARELAALVHRRH